ncbi:MAG: hypothetical protein CO128_04460 [Ignavibacteriales bacterium CG_4_9_14_3_um_filter_30_11]|nr:MAG: hypothetical protein CO128_04460 [Ignavibacteriales bacterium CG_4_9_14_3_um_filter_30_11]
MDTKEDENLFPIEKAYIKCGNWYKGIIAYNIEVFWDKDRNKKNYHKFLVNHFFNYQLNYIHP